MPRTFDMRLNATIFTRPPARSRLRSARTSSPSSSTPTYSRRAPFSLASSCHGTMLLWCSYSVVTITSPSRTLARPQECATRFIASVVPRTKTISSRDGAPTNDAIRSRADSYAPVASSASSYTALCMFAL